MTDQPDFGNVDLSALGLDGLELVELDPAALEAAASGTRTVDVLTAHLLDLSRGDLWNGDDATAVVHLLEMHDLPVDHRDSLLNALADQIYVQKASEFSDPYSLRAIGEAVFNTNYTAEMSPLTRIRLARAVSGYSPDRRS